MLSKLHSIASCKLHSVYWKQRNHSNSKLWYLSVNHMRNQHPIDALQSTNETKTWMRWIVYGARKSDGSICISHCNKKKTKQIYLFVMLFRNCFLPLCLIQMEDAAAASRTIQSNDFYWNVRFSNIFCVFDRGSAHPLEQSARARTHTHTHETLLFMHVILFWNNLLLI